MGSYLSAFGKSYVAVKTFATPITYRLPMADG
jgi:hypothetical protein